MTAIIAGRGGSLGGGSLWVGGQPGLHGEFQASQGYKVTPCLIQTNE